MARKPDVPCVACGKLLFSGRGCLPAGKRTCQPCRRSARLSGSPVGYLAAPRQRPCSFCGQIFDVPLGSKRKTCSAACVRAIQDRCAHVLGDRRRICEICGTHYLYNDPQQRTCSRACGVELRRSVPRSRSCVDCGGTFELRSAGPGNTRCDPCISRRRLRSVHVCVTCGMACRPGGWRYCSRSCALIGRRRFDRKYNERRPRKRPPLTCEVCGKHGLPSARRKRCDPCLQQVKREAKRRERRRSRNLTLGVRSEPYTLAYIAQRDRYTCQLCHKRVAMTKAVPHFKAPTIDHVVPRADGGDDTRANVQLAHFICNSRKSSRGTQQLVLIG